MAGGVRLASSSFQGLTRGTLFAGGPDSNAAKELDNVVVDHLGLFHIGEVTTSG